MKLLEFSVAATLLIGASSVVGDELETSIESGDRCPVTLGTDGLLEADSLNVYGSEALAVALPADGSWPTTGPTARIAVKLFWRSAGYRPGMEQHLHIDIVNLDDGPNDAVVKDVTSAKPVSSDLERARFDHEWEDGWLMLTGIDFPSPGYWEITGSYLGQSLTFVVETVDESGDRLSR